MNVADELEKLQQLHQSGGISDEEFAKAKAKLLTTPTGGLDSLFGGGEASNSRPASGPCFCTCRSWQVSSFPLPA